MEKVCYCKMIESAGLCADWSKCKKKITPRYKVLEVESTGKEFTMIELMYRFGIDGIKYATFAYLLRQDCKAFDSMKIMFKNKDDLGTILYNPFMSKINLKHDDKYDTFICTEFHDLCETVRIFDTKYLKSIKYAVESVCNAVKMYSKNEVLINRCDMLMSIFRLWA